MDIAIPLNKEIKHLSS